MWQHSLKNDLRSPSSWVLWLATGLLTLALYAFSWYNPGFYQHDEANHFLNMLRFWHEPQAILGNWAKPGYKIAFVIPALLGPGMVQLLSCFLAAAACRLLALVAPKYGANPWLAWLILATQPFFVMLAFRTYSEVYAAFLVAAILWAHSKSKHWLVFFLLGYVCTIRQEFLPIAFGYATYFIIKYKGKSLPSALFIALPLLIQHVVGWVYTGDPLYLGNQLVNTSEAIGGIYPRQGLWHYLEMALPVFGALIMVGVLAFLVTATQKSLQLHDFALFIAAGYFIIQSVINWQWLDFGPATAGNLRYMVVISPAISLIAAAGFAKRAEKQRQVILLIVLTLFGFATALYLNYEHNFLSHITQLPNPWPFTAVAAASLGVLLPLHWRWRAGIIGLAASLNFAAFVRLKQASPEDLHVYKMAMWYNLNETKFNGKQVLVDHPLFYYFTQKTEFDFKPKAKTVTLEHVQGLQAGGLVIWDSHYSFGPRRDDSRLGFDYFLKEQSEVFTIRNRYFDPKQRFLIFAVEKKP